MVHPPVDYSIYYVTGRHLLPTGVDFFEQLEEACASGVTVVQLREKNISTLEFFQIGQKCKAICDKYSIPLLINDRLDLALSLSCGLHVGQTDLPAKIARQLLGPDALLGLSINTPEEMKTAIEEGVVDYVGIGPAYETGTKKDLNAILGVRGVRDILTVLGESKIKSVIIGGVNSQTLPNILSQTPAPLPNGQYRSLDGVAIVSAIAASRTPANAARELSNNWKAGPARPLEYGTRTISASDFITSTQESLKKLRGGAGKLVHHITNSVVQTQTANLTLALSSSPIMSSLALEIPSLSPKIGALILNMGTLSEAQVAAHLCGGLEAKKNGKTVILDPVGVGATQYRKDAISMLMNKVHVSIVKGNAGEIASLANSSEVQSRGVDSLGSGFKDPATVVRTLARREKLIVAMTGPIDYVSDGEIVVAIENGHHWQSVITGSGCMATTAVACFGALVETDDLKLLLKASVAGLLTVNVAAEIAAERPDVRGPGTFVPALIDECYSLTVEEIQKRARIKVI
ncbi:thiamine biosynthetic bifunctional enzyme Thi4 [Meredithblackwellia eburnea MCA 4105]